MVPKLFIIIIKTSNFHPKMRDKNINLSIVNINYGKIFVKTEKRSIFNMRIS